MKERQTYSLQQLLQQIQKLLPSGKQVYNTLMEAIEIDLLTNNIATLPEKYADETVDEREARLQRYNKAIEKYDTIAGSFFESLETEVDAHKQAVVAESNAQDTTAMKNLEDKLQDATNE